MLTLLQVWINVRHYFPKYLLSSFFSSSFWNSNYTYIRSVDIGAQVTEALFICFPNFIFFPCFSLDSFCSYVFKFTGRTCPPWNLYLMLCVFKSCLSTLAGGNLSASLLFELWVLFGFQLPSSCSLSGLVGFTLCMCRLLFSQSLKETIGQISGAPPFFS